MGKTVVLIPARGGSKGIPHKNLCTLYEVPGTNIEKTLLSNAIDQIAKIKDSIENLYVSTDSAFITNHVVETYEYTNISKFIKIHKRSAETSSDEASTESVMLEFVEEADLDDEDIIVLVQCTSPFLDSGKIVEALQAINSGDFDSALSVTRSHRFYWQTHHGASFPINYNFNERKRRQEFAEDENFSEVYIENGSFYITKVKSLKNHKNRLSGKIYLTIQEEEYSNLEIDSMNDLIIARAIFQSLLNQEGKE